MKITKKRRKKTRRQKPTVKPVIPKTAYQSSTTAHTRRGLGGRCPDTQSHGPRTSFTPLSFQPRGPSQAESHQRGLEIPLCAWAPRGSQDKDGIIVDRRLDASTCLV